jgi:hypothetical protein
LRNERFSDHPQKHKPLKPQTRDSYIINFPHVNLTYLIARPHFGNLKPHSFSNAVKYNCLSLAHSEITSLRIVRKINNIKPKGTSFMPTGHYLRKTCPHFRNFDTASQSLTVLSRDANASVLPSGVKATAVTQPKWPSSVCSSPSDLASQSLTVSSCDVDASILPSSVKATAVTQPEWPSSVCSNAFQLISTLGNLRIHFTEWLLNCCLIMLVIGANARAL